MQALQAGLLDLISMQHILLLCEDELLLLLSGEDVISVDDLQAHAQYTNG